MAKQRKKEPKRSILADFISGANIKAKNRDQRAEQQKRKYFLIVSEGNKSEPQYFDDLKKDLPPDAITIYTKGTGLQTSAVVLKAASLMQKRVDSIKPDYDEVWALIDKDAFTDFDEAITLAEKLGIEAGWSNTCFELWYLLHFQALEAGLDSKTLTTKLEEQISKKQGKAFQYGKEGLYKLLCDYGDVQAAIKRATKLLEKQSEALPSVANPRTRVHILVERLLFP
jgi:hypothetical protein